MNPAGFTCVPEHGLSVLCGGRNGFLAQHVQPRPSAAWAISAWWTGGVAISRKSKRVSFGNEQGGMVRVDAGRRKHLVRYLPAGLHRCRLWL